MRRLYLIYKVAFIIVFVLGFLTGCNKDSLFWSGGPGEIVFDIDGIALEVVTETKASVVTATDLSTNGFRVNCVKGSAGSDIQVWSNASFTKVGDVWKGDKFWPYTNESYRFYAVYPSTTMTYASGGPSIIVSNASDYVCAYASSPSYKTSNTLNFYHIFARLNSVTVNAADGYTISGVSVSITPKTGGTYNLYTGSGQTDGTGWTSTTLGSATSIANASPGTKSNDIYLVPGTYTLTASWTATKGDYTQTFSGKTSDVDLVAGKTNNLTVSLSGNASEIAFSVSIAAWGSNAVNAGTFSLVDPAQFTLPGVFTVDDSGSTVRFSCGNLWAHVSAGPTDTDNYGADLWRFHSHQWDWCNQSLEVGHTVDHFGWVGASASYDSYGLCTNDFSGNVYYGTSESDVLKTDWGSIPGVMETCGGGWFTLSTDQWNYLLTQRTTGGSVSGTANARYSQATIRTDVSGVNGVILFPDGETFAAGEFTTVGTLNAQSSWTTKCTAAQWTVLEAKGCVFLPASGYRFGAGTNYVGSVGSYWSSTPYSATVARDVYFYSGYINPRNGNSRYRGFAVRLVR